MASQANRNEEPIIPKAYSIDLREWLVHAVSILSLQTSVN